MSATDLGSVGRRVEQLIADGDVAQAEAVVRRADASGLAAPAGVGWYVLASHLEPVAARAAYRRAMDLGPLEVRAWAAVKLGRLLAAAGEREAARAVFASAVRLGDPHGSPAALDALDDLAQWPRPAANLALTAAAMAAGAAIGALLVRVGLPVAPGGDPDGWLAVVVGTFSAALGWSIARWRLSPPDGRFAHRPRPLGLIVGALGAAVGVAGLLAIAGSPAALERISWINAWAELADQVVHPSPGSALETVERYVALPGGVLALVLLGVAASDPRRTRVYVAGSIYEGASPRVVFLAGHAKHAALLMSVAFVAAVTAACARTALGL